MILKGIFLNALLLTQFSAVMYGNDNIRIQQLKSERLKTQNELSEHDKILAEKKKLIASVRAKVSAFFEKQLDSIKFNKQEKEEFKEEIDVYHMLFEEFLRSLLSGRKEFLETLIERYEEIKQELLKIDNELNDLQK